MRRALLSLPFAALLLGCPNTPAGHGGAGGTTTVTVTSDAGLSGICALPGTVAFTGGGTVTVPGGSPSWPSLAFLHLPQGFCAHYFGKVGNARNMRFAPGGELFVASPTMLTTGNGQGGQDAIVVLPDDDHDGVADTPVSFLTGLTATQGMMFSPGWFYYQDGKKFLKVPYASGDRAPSAAGTVVVDVEYFYYPLHWPKGIDQADDGTIYISNGGDQAQQCVEPELFTGGILKIDGTAGGAQVAQGLRNPMSVRCQKGHNKCFATEMAKDYTAGAGGREKIIPIHQGDDWGFPCCASQNIPYTDVPSGTDCSKVTPENVSFFIGDSPFSLAFAPSTWPSPYAGSAIVALHGAAGNWVGTRVVAIATDPSTGDLVAGSNLDRKDMGGMSDFVTGWDDGQQDYGRAASVEFSTDGRLFVANDQTGVIFWVAPIP
jgi:glucose/arabinose dehydrogenase